MINENIQCGIEHEKLDVRYEHEERHTYPTSIARNKQIYVTLAKTKTGNINKLQAWQPVAIGQELLSNLSADKIAIRGTSNGNNIVYGLETYYMPEDRKDSVNTDIDRSRSTPELRNLLVQIKVDRRGFATPVSLWIGKKEYHF